MASPIERLSIFTWTEITTQFAVIILLQFRISLHQKLDQMSMIKRR